MLTREQAVELRSRFPEWVKVYDVGVFQVHLTTWAVVQTEDGSFVVQERRTGVVKPGQTVAMMRLDDGRLAYTPSQAAVGVA